MVRDPGHLCSQREPQLSVHSALCRQCGGATPTPAPSVLPFPVSLRLPGSVKTRSGLKSRAPHDHKSLLSNKWHLWELCCHPGSSLSFLRGSAYWAWRMWSFPIYLNAAACPGERPSSAQLRPHLPPSSKISTTLPPAEPC